MNEIFAHKNLSFYCFILLCLFFFSCGKDEKIAKPAKEMVTMNSSDSREIIAISELKVYLKRMYHDFEKNEKHTKENNFNRFENKPHFEYKTKLLNLFQSLDLARDMIASIQAPIIFSNALAYYQSNACEHVDEIVPFGNLRCFEDSWDIIRYSILIYSALEMPNEAIISVELAVIFIEKIAVYDTPSCYHSMALIKNLLQTINECDNICSNLEQRELLRNEIKKIDAYLDNVMPFYLQSQKAIVLILLLTLDSGVDHEIRKELAATLVTLNNSQAIDLNLPKQHMSREEIKVKKSEIITKCNETFNFSIPKDIVSPVLKFQFLQKGSMAKSVGKIR